MSPEQLARQQYDGFKGDVFALGCIFFIMLVGVPPFQRASRGDWWYDKVASGQMDVFWYAHKQQYMDRTRRDLEVQSRRGLCGNL